jgi:hypothetical protein
MRTSPSALVVVCMLILTSPLSFLARAEDAPPPALPPITFNLNFEGGSLGTIEKLEDATFRCHVEGQHDERGRNRQANWYYFRMDHVKGRDVTLTLTDFVGEYNDKPGAVAMGPDLFPVFSLDGRTWKHFDAMDWDKDKKEATVHFHGDGDSIWIAHIAPYTPRDLQRLLADVRRFPDAVVEVIGKTARDRDIPMVTVTDLATPDEDKKLVWLQARQHAWEAGTSYVMEGAIRFAISEEAKDLRRRVIFKFTPMVDLDGCASGKVRFNANNYDVNRHWPDVDLRRPEMLRLMPEIWYTKKAIVANAGKIDLMVNLHNTETGEYIATQAQDDQVLARMRRFEQILNEKTSFDPSKPLSVVKPPMPDTNSLWENYRVPVMLMEQRIGTGKKMGHRPEIEDRTKFGRELLQAMAETVLNP